MSKREKVSKESWKEALKIFSYVLPYKFYFIVGLIMLFLSSMVFTVFPYIAGMMIDVAQGKPTDFELTLAQIGIALTVILFLQAIFSYFRVITFAIITEKSIATIRKDLFSKVINLPISFFDQNRTGDLMSRITDDVEKLYSVFSITLAEFLRQIIVLIIGIAFLTYTAAKLSLIMLATIPIIVVGGIVFGKMIKKLSKRRQDFLADTNIILSESVQSIHDVKSFTNELFEEERYANSMKDTVKIALKYANGRALFSVFIIMILFGALFFIFWKGAVLVQTGEMSAGNFISFVFFTGLIAASIGALGNFYPQLVGAVGATERIREILNMDNEMNAELSYSPIRLQGEIAFKNIHFSYPTRKDISVLNGLDFEIKPGQKIALVGESGVGKSTIVQLLLRFYNLDSGEITIDGKPIDSIHLRAYRENFAIVPQEVLLFGGSIRDNIKYGNPNASDDEIIKAAKEANAWSFISSFPEKLDTLVGERGVKLSGGQKQRVAIARAILKNPTILLLDEATSALDAQSELVVQEALENLMKDRTSIIIAHRLATIRDVDCIFVIKDGKIVESGTHDDLIKNMNGSYAQLANLQFS